MGNYPFQRTFFSPTYFTIKATFNHISIYFPLWGLTALIFFFKSNCHTWDFISALLVQWCHQSVVVGREAPAQVASSWSGWDWDWGTERNTHSGFCAVLEKPVRLLYWLCSQEVDANCPSLRAEETLWVKFAKSFCLLTLVLFLVHDSGQLGCHFLQIPVWHEEFDFEDGIYYYL
jgi:hypothetical protein